MSNPAPVTILFVCEGMDAMRTSIASIESRMIQSDRATTRSQEQAAKERVKNAAAERKARLAEYTELFKQVDAQEKSATKAAKKSADEKVKATEDEAKRKERIRENSMRMAHQLLEQEVRDEKKAADDKVRAATMAAKRIESANEGAMRREVSLRRRYGNAMGRGAMSGAGSMLGSAASMMGMAMSVGGGFALADATRKELSFERSVAQASNMSYIPGTTTRAQVDPSVISGMSKGTQALTNIDKEDVANGIKRYVGLSSDFEGLHGKTSSGKSGLDELAILSKASGTDFTQLMEAAASIKANNQGMSADGLITSMRQLLGAGKQGTIPLDQLASHVGMIQASATMYAGSSTTEGLAKNQSSLLGLAQLAGRATGGDAERAATSVKDFSTDLMKEGHKADLTPSMLYEGGKSVNGMLAPDQLLANLFEKTKGAPDIAQKALGQRSLPIFEALKPIFDAAEAVKKGSGVGAVQDTVKKFENQSCSAADTMLEFNVVMATNTEKLDAAFKHIEETIETKAVPFIERFANGLTKHEPEIDKFLSAVAAVAEFMVSHPWEVLFAIMEKNMIGSIVKAGIGVAIKQAMVQAMGGGSGTLGAVGSSGGFVGAGGVAGALAAGAIITTLAVTTATIGMAIIDAWGDSKNKENEEDVALGQKIDNSVRGVDVTYDAKGNVIGAKNASVQKQIADLQEQREKVQKNLDDSLDTTAPMSESYGSDSDGARVDAMTKLLEQIDTKLAQIAGNTANQKPFRFSPIYGDRPEYVTTDGSGGNDSRNRPQTDRAGAK